MTNLEGKIIIVTGGSGLLGKCIIDKIKEEKGLAINADINIETSEDLTNIKCDITDEISIKNAIQTICKKYGKIDGLVNNAYPRTKDWGLKFEDIHYDSWQKNVDWQLNSQFLFCQQVFEVMKAQGSGSIVNMASIYGVVGADFSVYEGTQMTMPAAYSAIKGGLINFSRYIASYFGKFGVRVNCVSPGGIFDNQNPIFVENYNNKVPMKRMGTPDDIAAPVVFLLSDGASYITGHNLVVDGGWTAI
jgi:NAD(P)-dependent dehydrogenase (short-subunit alcohol dehydrogenase family)